MGEGVVAWGSKELINENQKIPDLPPGISCRKYVYREYVEEPLPSGASVLIALLGELSVGDDVDAALLDSCLRLAMHRARLEVRALVSVSAGARIKETCNVFNAKT